MAFLNFLGGGMDPIQALLSGASPGFAGGMFGGEAGPMIPGMGGIEQALAQNATMRPQQPSRPKLGVGDWIGLLGDAVRGFKGQDPVYGPRMQEQRKQQTRNNALANYLDDPEGAIRALFAAGDPETALAVMKARQGGEPPAFVQEFEYRDRLDPERRKAYDDYAAARKFNPYGAPLVMNQGDRYIPSGGEQDGLPQVSDQATYDAVPPGAQYVTPDGNIRTKGGATASPSPTFP